MKKILKKSICVILTFVMLVGLTAVVNSDTVYAASDIVNVSITVNYGQTEARSICDMINKMRASKKDAWCWDESNTKKDDYSGAQPLTYSYTLEKLAMKRAAEIALYYSHTRPSGERCFSIYEEEGVTWSAVGENIAYGYSSAKDVNKAWREDDKDYGGQGHRRNMLASKYNCVGIGHVYYNGRHYWVEEFANTPDLGNAVDANDSKTKVSVDVSDQYVSLADIEKSTSVKTFKISSKTAVLKKGKKLTLKVTGNEGSVKWTSSNKKVATVNKNGVVTAKKKGKATIKAFCPALGKSVSCKVKVKR